jgi:hypothetical protein
LNEIATPLNIAPSQKIEPHRSEVEESSISSIKNKRALSHPSDLNVITSEDGKINDDYNHLQTDDNEKSDAGSLTSNHIDKEPVLAVALFPFHADGVHELSLETGNLLEVFEQDDGCWWWGRLKFDDSPGVEDKFIHQQGWFPRDFVKVISSTEYTDSMRTQPSSGIVQNPI